MVASLKCHVRAKVQLQPPCLALDPGEVVPGDIGVGDDTAVGIRDGSEIILVVVGELIRIGPGIGVFRYPSTRIHSGLDRVRTAFNTGKTPLLIVLVSGYSVFIGFAEHFIKRVIDEGGSPSGGAFDCGRPPRRIRLK